MRSWFAIAALLMAASPASAQVTLSLTTMSPPGSDFSDGFFRPWAERVNGAAAGTVKVDPRDGYAVANYGNVYDRVTQDAVQIGWGMQGLIAGKFPLTEIATFPFEADSAEQASTALWRLFQAGDLGDEYKGLKLVLLGTYPMNGVHYTKKPPTLDGFKGLKVRAASKPQAEWIEHLDGAPISMAPEDLYTALQRGTIDATLQAWSAFGPLKLADVTNYHIDIAFGTSTIMIFMTQAKFDSLPPTARKAIDDNSGETTSRAWGKFCDELAGRLRKSVLALPNQTEGKLTPEEASAWKQRVLPVEEAWTKAHPHGDELLQRYRAYLAQVKAAG